jgi:hypothetical protein
MSDGEFDRLLAELASLEKQHPELHDANSPTARVGGEIDGFKAISEAIASNCELPIEARKLSQAAARYHRIGPGGGALLRRTGRRSGADRLRSLRPCGR